MDKIIIYGAGQKGKETYSSLKQCGLAEKIECFCDRNWKEIKSVYGIPVKAYDDLKETKNIFMTMSHLRNICKALTVKANCKDIKVWAK